MKQKEMKPLLPTILVAFSLAMTTQLLNAHDNSVVKLPNSIATLVQEGVEVRVNQLQIQRIGAPVELKNEFKMAVPKPQKFGRTISISLSQKENGKTIGPTHIILKNGTILRPMTVGNQKLMNRIANARTPDGFDFSEYWFELPTKIKLGNVFPITVVHNTTNAEQKKVKFVFKGIEP